MKHIAAFTVLLIALAAPASAGFDDGMAAYKRGDYATALREFRSAAARGNPTGQNILGVMYGNGRGVRQDFDKAMALYRQAADQGYAAAQFNLSIMYGEGRGVARDYSEAAKWSRKAADQGYPLAQYNLGNYYRDGQGVKQDDREAVRWFRRAANQGMALAQHNLGIMIGNGRGVWLDHAEAFTWFGLAAARLPLGKTRDSAIKNRDKAEKKLTSEQIAEASRIVKNWRPRGQTAPEHAILANLRRKRSSGSGFVVSPGGLILTNDHVVRGCGEVRVRSQLVGVMAHDRKIDLALLKGARNSAAVATFRGGKGIRLGEDTIVAGFPLHGLLTTELNITKGIVSALAGPGNDRRLIQITAPVQPGNSGGPILDSSGNVVGVVVARLDALKLARKSGILPQNVNFAIGADTVRAFLDSRDVRYRTARSVKGLSTADIAAKAKGFTVLVECWK